MGLGEVSFTSTVWSSIAVQTESAGMRVFRSEDAWRTRSAENTTSAAVKSLPLENLTPWRRLKRQVSGSTISQLSARPGMISRFLSRLVSPS